MPQKQYVSHYDNLKDKWADKSRELQKSLWQRHAEAFEWIQNQAKNTAMTSAAAFMLFSAPATGSSFLSQVDAKGAYIKDLDKKVFVVGDLSQILPDKVEPLTSSQEDVVAETLRRHFQIPVTPVLQDKRLNVNYGYIGAEQHLARYPGDNMSSHFDTPEEASLYASSGMAPGLGAYRYFTDKAGNLTEKGKLQEKYYIAVQTFLSDGYNQRVAEYNNFFKFRKMLVVNPENGKAIVAVIGDAGPGESTGKEFGGSPEVMHYLERVDGAQKGPVLIYFVDDPNDQIPLGPIEAK